MNSSSFYFVVGYTDPSSIPVPPVSTSLTPIMTSNNSPLPYVASTSYTIGAANDAWKAFDSDPTTQWVSGGADGSSTQWIELDFGNAVLVNSIKLRSRSGGYNSEAPRDFSLEGSNNNIDFVEVYRKLASVFGVDEEKQSYFGNYTLYRYYRLFIRCNNGNYSNTSLSEFNFINNDNPSLNDNFKTILPVFSNYTNGAMTVSAAGEYNNESLYTWKAFNAHLNNTWAHESATGSSWLKVDLGIGVTKNVKRYRLYSRSDWTYQNPKDFTLQGSNDDITYTVLDSRSGITWSPFSGQEFIVATPGTYRYYKLNMTAIGSGTIFAVAQFELSE